MKKLIVIDGNSILNRAFYGIMGSKMLQTADGTYTNAVYGFLTIMFRQIEDENPDYLVVAFDVKKPTKRHELYSEYKGTRKGMPEELAQQMPIIKDVLNAMNIKVMEKQGYEADDILGTLSAWGAREGVKVILLTGDRDSFQLAQKNVIIRMPRTRQGKTEIEDFDETKIQETYGVLPKQMIEVKGLMGDSSDNIPGVPGIGEKTALNLIQKYGNIDALYEAIEAGDPAIKGKQKEKLVENKNLAYLSKTLGTIDIDAPIEKSFDEIKVGPWDNVRVLELFKYLRFKRFIERFELESQQNEKPKELGDLFEYVKLDSCKELIEKIYGKKELYYSFETVSDENGLILKQRIVNINCYQKEEKKVYCAPFKAEELREIYEDKTILKCGYELKKDFILLKQENIQPQNMMFDAKIAMYLLNAGSNLYSPEEIAQKYLNLDLEEYYKDDKENGNIQASFFDEPQVEQNNYQYASYAYVIGETKETLENALREINQFDLFYDIEMPTTEILADMQYTGVLVDKEDIQKMSEELKVQIQKLSEEIYELAGEEFNINSPKQLGVILFEKLELPYAKKNKNGYSTDVDTLEKLKSTHPIIEKILSYRQMSKLNSTFVEGMLPFINPVTKRIHTTFHQTVTTTGRLSSSDPNLQNIPTRTELGKQIRKLFKAEKRKSIFGCRLFAN